MSDDNKNSEVKWIPGKDVRMNSPITPLERGRAPMSITPEPGDVNTGRMPTSITPISPGSPATPAPPTNTPNEGDNT